MNTFQLRKAERKQIKVRVGLSSPSGGGKTYSSLLLAYGITNDWSKIALIDTESGRGDLYSDLGEYNIVRLKAPFSPERYIEYIEGCEDAGIEVIIIDSISHEWEGKGGCLEINEALAHAKYRGNTWSAWNETTPRHQKFIEKIITSDCHIITTVRNKVDTVMGEDKKVKKVGVKEITREGFEYELLVNFNIDRDTHKVIASKDNTRLFEGKDPFVITPDTGKQLLKWVMSGKKVEAPKKPDVTKKDVVDYIRSKFENIKDEDIKPKILELVKLDPATEEPAKVLKALKKLKTVTVEPKKDITNKIAKASKK